MRRTLTSLNDVPRTDPAAAQDLAKNAARGHDAVAGEVIDGALGVAVLADLADPQPHRAADDELVADGQGAEVEAARGQVLGEGAGAEGNGRLPAGAGFLGLDVLDGEERHL